MRLTALFERAEITLPRPLLSAGPPRQPARQSPWVQPLRLGQLVYHASPLAVLAVFLDRLGHHEPAAAMAASAFDQIDRALRTIPDTGRPARADW
jgi:hypothetical protein